MTASTFDRFEHRDDAERARRAWDGGDLFLWRGVDRIGATPRATITRRDRSAWSKMPEAWRLTEGDTPKDPQYDWMVVG